MNRYVRNIQTWSKTAEEKGWQQLGINEHWQQVKINWTVRQRKSMT